MARRASSDRHPGNGVGVSRTNGPDPQRVAPAAGLNGNGHGNGGNNGAAPSHALGERGQAEAAIRERDTVRSVASLAAASAHEINNPLAAAMGHLQLLADGVDAKGRRRIDEILEALSRIQEIIIRMTQITRLELTDPAPYLPEMLDLSRSSELRSPDNGGPDGP